MDLTHQVDNLLKYESLRLIFRALTANFLDEMQMSPDFSIAVNHNLLNQPDISPPVITSSGRISVLTSLLDVHLATFKAVLKP